MSDENVTDTSTPPAPAPPASRTVRDADFRSVYANNVQVETSSLDIRLVFGQFDQQLGPSGILQKASVTVSWQEAKALANLILSNLAFYEAMNGRVRMPRGMTPTPPTFDEPNEILQQVQRQIAKVHAVIFGED